MMKLKLTMIAAAMLVAGSVSAKNPSTPSDVAWQDALETCVAEQAKRMPFMGVIAAGKGNARYFYKNGFADADGKQTFTRDTPFLLASVGKLYTQAAIGKLAQDGKLKLDVPVREYLPELPESFAPITIEHLLNHRSGVASMTRADIADAPAMAGARTARDLVAVVAAKPLSFAPDSGDEYSNGGYYLLGAVIESVSGQTYRDYIAKHIFDALGMTSSSFEPSTTSAAPLTLLTGPDQPPASKPQPRKEFPEFKASSAGGAFSSIADIEIFAAALLSDKFLSEQTKSAVFSQGKAPWRIRQGGGTVGSNTGVWVLPEDNTWLVVLSNFDPPAGDVMWHSLQSVLNAQGCKAPPPKGPPPRPMMIKQG